MATSPYRSWVEISRAQVAENFQRIRTAVGSEVAVFPVVKADAYRHGAVEICRVLDREGVQGFAVSNVEEGVSLRQAGFAQPILVMADFLPVGRLALLEHGLTPVLHSLDDLPELSRLAARLDQKVGFHLKIDSGMGRLGTRGSAEQILAVLKDCPHIELQGLMTHFASVTDFDNPQTGEQEVAFFNLLSDLRAAGVHPRYVHLSSTGAIAYRRKEAWGNLVRPGHALYGYVSPPRGHAPGNLLKVKPVMCWKAAVLTVKDMPAGAKIGYGGIFRTQHPMRIAVLAVGYADGIPHRLSNRGKVIVGGRYANILGAVSMDVTTVDVTHCPELKVGDAVTLMGSEGEATIDAQDIARLAGTISYNVLCGISSRVKRVYV